MESSSMPRSIAVQIIIDDRKINSPKVPPKANAKPGERVNHGYNGTNNAWNLSGTVLKPSSFAIRH